MVEQQQLDIEPIIERSKDLDRITVWFPEPHKTTLKQFLTDQEDLIREVIELRRVIDHLQNWCGAPDEG